MPNKRCDRCKSVMLKEEISLYDESFERKWLSAYHCMYCGRSEYGTDAHASPTSIQAAS
jgi:hypothetical protein